MFLKLFKHDFRGLGRWLWPVMIGIGGAAVLGFVNMLVLGGAGRGMDNQRPGAEALLAASLGGTALIAMALAAAATVIAVLIFVRFYKSMVTDEAYLTFTLPATAGQLIGSKFLSAAVWAVIGGAVTATACLAIFCGILISGGEDARDFFSYFWKDLGEVLSENLGTFLLFLLFTVSGVIRSYFQISCAILFGASVVRKNKALAAVGMVLAVNFVLNLILSVAGVAGLLPLMFNLSYGVGAEGMPVEASLWIQIALNAVLTAVFWWWSWRIAKKSVNIE